MNLGPNVTILEHEGRTFYVVGTAHISEKSVQEVRETIEKVQPDTIAIELCQTRFDAMADPDRWRKLDIFQIIKQKKVLFTLAQLSLSSYQKRLGDQLGVKPGAEMTEAMKIAEATGTELALIDRDIQATLKRTWRNLGFVGKFKVLGLLTGSMFSKDELTEEKLEEIKDRDAITEMMKAFAEELPQVQIPLIDERDRYLIASTEKTQGQKVVVVVGAGHVPGMIKYLGTPTDLEALTVIPPPKKWVGLLKWIIPALMMAAFYFGYRNHGGETLETMLLSWILPNSIFAAVLTAVAGGKLLSIITAFVSSPITSLNPTIGAGIAVGMVEAWQRKPTVEDCERVPEDATSLRGIYKNPFTRVLLVALMANLGSALGAYLGAFLVARLLG
jgi:pheromone shutdown-related protein TraB